MPICRCPKCGKRCRYERTTTGLSVALCVNPSTVGTYTVKGRNGKVLSYKHHEIECEPLFPERTNNGQRR